MVNITNTTHVSPKPVAKTRKEEASEVESHTDERRAAAKTQQPIERRRRRNDRRSKRDKFGRPVYDMRSGRGRRKTDQIPPSIELDV